MSNVVECTHRHQAIGVLRQSPIAGSGVAPQSLDMQKRMLNPGSHRALSAVLQFLRVAQWRASLRPLIGEVPGVGRRFNHRLFLPPVGAVAIDAGFLSVQELSEHLGVVHVGRCGAPL